MPNTFNAKEDLPDGKEINDYIEFLKVKAIQAKHIEEKDGKQALNYFAARGASKQVQALIAHFKAGQGLKTKGNDLSYQEAIDLPDKDLPNDTALHDAANAGHLEVVQILLSAGANPSITNKKGNTALHLAANKGFVKIVEALLTKLAPPDDVAKVNGDAYTPLLLILEQRVVTPREENPKDYNATAGKILAYYLAHRVSLNLAKKKDTGNSYLHSAIRNEFSLDVIDKIIQLNPELISDLNGRRETPLILAVNAREADSIVDLLLKHPIDISIKDEDGQNALHYATQANNKTAIVGRLLAKDPSIINIPNQNGATPLHLATKYGNAELVALLLENKAAINQANADANTPAHIAVLEGRKEIYELLVHHGADLTLINKDGLSVETLLQQNPFPLKGSRLGGRPNLRASAILGDSKPSELSIPSALPSARTDSSQPSSARSIEPLLSQRDGASGEEYSISLQKELADAKKKLAETQARQSQNDAQIDLKSRWQGLNPSVKWLLISCAVCLLLSCVIAFCLFCPPIATHIHMAPSVVPFLKGLLGIPRQATWVLPYAQAFLILLPELTAIALASLALMGYGLFKAGQAVYHKALSRPADNVIEMEQTPSSSHAQISLKLHDVTSKEASIGDYINTACSQGLDWLSDTLNILLGDDSTYQKPTATSPHDGYKSVPVSEPQTPVIS